MSATSDFVLVTGASSHTGAYIVRDLLARGSRVRAVVRPEESSTVPLRKRFKDEVASGALTFAFVADMAADRAFDEAVKDVTGIIHAAAANALNWAGDAYRDLINPTVNGVTTLLRSAAREYSVKSVVLMSSMLAHMPHGFFWPQGEAAAVRDDTWNPYTVEEAVRSGDRELIYGAAKLQADRAAWELVRKLHYPFRFATMGVALSVGPVLLEDQSVAEGAGLRFWKAIKGNFSEAAGSEKQHWAYLPDVAQGFIRALDEPKANRKRFLFLTNDALATPCEVARLARLASPGINRASEPNPARVRADAPYEPKHVKEILGMELVGMERIVREVVEQGLAQHAVVG